jgi:hypothetical protein
VIKRKMMPEAEQPPYFTICKGCGAMWLAQDMDGAPCPFGNPDADGRWHVTFAFELDPSDLDRTVEQVANSFYPDEWDIPVFPIDGAWDTPLRDMKVR